MAALLALATGTVVDIADARDPDTISASDKAAARAAMDRGDELFAEAKHREALTEYQRADQIMGVPSTGILVGKALEAVGELVKAHDRYLAVGRYQHTPGKAMPDVFINAQKVAAERAAVLDGKIPTLVLEVKGLPPGVKPDIAIDGEPINAAVLTRRVNPGTVSITAKAAGHLEKTESATLAESETKTVTLTLDKDPNAVAVPTPAPTPTPTPDPGPGDTTPRDEGTIVPAAIAFGVGGAALIVGGVFGGLTFARESELSKKCKVKTACNETALISKATTFANVSNAMFAVGGVGVVLGVVFIFVFAGDDEPETAALMPVLSPEMIGVAGRF